MDVCVIVVALGNVRIVMRSYVWVGVLILILWTFGIYMCDFFFNRHWLFYLRVCRDCMVLVLWVCKGDLRNLVKVGKILFEIPKYF